MFHRLHELNMKSYIIECDRLFIMLAKHKCLNLFPALKSEHFPPSFSPKRTAAPEPKHDYWSLALEYHALPWLWICNRPKYCVAQLHVFMMGEMQFVFVSKSPIPCSRLQREHEADQSDLFQTYHALQKDNKSAPGPSQRAYNPLSLFGQKCVCKQDTPSSSLYRGCQLFGEVDTSGVRRGSKFSLHLT